MSDATTKVDNSLEEEKPMGTIEHIAVSVVFTPLAAAGAAVLSSVGLKAVGVLNTLPLYDSGAPALHATVGVGTAIATGLAYNSIKSLVGTFNKRSVELGDDIAHNSVGQDVIQPFDEASQEKRPALSLA